MGIATETTGRTLVVTIDRPQRRNAVDRTTAGELHRAFVAFDADGGLDVAVLTGAGGNFCAGADLHAIGTGDGNRVSDDPDAPAPLGCTRLLLDKPVIAAVEGFAVAGGLEIALSCDLLVAAAGAKLGVPEVKRSLVAAGGALLRLPRKVPYGVAMELALTGDPITAERGQELGLVNRVAEPGGAVDAALELAATIAKNGPLALTATKEILESQWDWSDAEFWQKQSEIAGPVLVSEDSREGAVAFAEKRDPVWKGR